MSVRAFFVFQGDEVAKCYNFSQMPQKQANLLKLNNLDCTHMNNTCNVVLRLNVVSKSSR